MISTCRMLLAIALCILLGTSASVLAGSRPNLLLIVADDLGWGDLGCTGSKTIKTPRIDELAAKGVLCTQAYVASSVCSPSRAGFITGRDPRRFGYEGNLNNNAESYTSRPELLGLPIEEHTLGDQLKAAGYATALVGKWHLGQDKPFHPNQRGFDFFCGMLNGGHNYFPSRGPSRIERNGKLVDQFSSPYLTDFFSDEAIRWLDQIKFSEDTKPWMLMLSYNAPHTPMQARADDYAACSHIKNKTRRTYAAMVQALDRAIGNVFDHLDSIDERENTLIVFLSDNGGATQNASWNGPLSGAKGTLREGGVRVPMIWNWPTKIRSGVVTDQVVSALDLLPTFLAAAESKTLDLEAPPSYVDETNCRKLNRNYGGYDGVNLLPFLKSSVLEPDEALVDRNLLKQSLAERTLFWRLQGQSAVLLGDKKLINLRHRPAQLFQPGLDPGEQKDLSLSHREDMLELFEVLGSWESRLGTTPIWDSSPKWWGVSAREYDELPPSPEPR